VNNADNIIQTPQLLVMDLFSYVPGACESVGWSKI